MESSLTTNGKLWICQILSERYGLDFKLSESKDGIAISLVSAPSAGSIIFSRINSSFYKAGKSKLPLSHWCSSGEGWSTAISSKLPAPGMTKPPDQLVYTRGNDFVFEYDVPGLITWALCRVEEFDGNTEDKHGRFSALSSHAYKNGYLDRPVVDEWLDVVGQVIQKKWPECQISSPKFRVEVSHDVDRPSRYAFAKPGVLLRRVLSDALRTRSFQPLYRGPYVKINSINNIKAQDPYNTFDWLMAQSAENKICSIFNFLVGGTTCRFDGDYRIGQQAISALITSIIDKGHRVGLHFSYDSFMDKRKIQQECEEFSSSLVALGLKQKVVESRMHYLRWNSRITPAYLSAAGVDVDTTLTFHDAPGFRAGTCFEYPAYDLLQDEILSLRIRPLIAMEKSISSYQKISYGSEAIERLRRLKERCQRVGGTFTLLWHNCELDTDIKKLTYTAALAP